MKRCTIAVAFGCAVFFAPSGAIPQTDEEQIAAIPPEWYAPDDHLPDGHRVPLFRQQLHQLSQLLFRTFRVCHLPPYCSKYNPVDHCLFCHLSRSLQALCRGAA